MIALRLVRLIETHSEELARDVTQKLHVNPHTTELRKVPEAELRSRNHEILQHLSEWLLTKTASDVESRYRRLGAERAAQGVSLADYCWAIVLTKEHLWEFLQRQAFLCSPVEIYGELELLRLLDRFFDRALCYAAEGYEEYARTAKPGETSALESPAAALN